MTRTMARSDGQLRIWERPKLPIDDDAAVMAVEWQGSQIGHPGTYAMVGGHLADEPTVRVGVASGGRWRRSLAGYADVVTFGLPNEFEEAIRRRAAPGLNVTIAAAGRASSSPLTFSHCTDLLCQLLSQGVPPEDELWRRWADIAR